MMKIVLASRNKKKMAEMRTLLRAQGGALSEVEVLSLEDIGFSEEIEENGDSFVANARIKASVPARLGYIGIADDSGLCVDSLGGAPGIYSARYAGEPSNDENNNRKLLASLSEIPEKERSSRYVCAIVCVFPDGREIFVEKSCEGRILSDYRGEGGFGYDPLFFYPPADKTFAEMTPEEKNMVSHRGKAIRAFGNRFTAFAEKNRLALSGKNRAALRSLANDFSPIFQIGKNGISGETCRQISNALEARELIKVSVLENSLYDAGEAAELLAVTCGAAVISVVGRRFVLYRPSKSNPRIVLE